MPSIAHHRIVKVVLDNDAAGNVEAVDSVEYFRTRAKFDDDEGFAIEHTASGEDSEEVEIEFGELLPPPTHLVIELNDTSGG